MTDVFLHLVTPNPGDHTRFPKEYQFGVIHLSTIVKHATAFKPCVRNYMGPLFLACFSS